MSQLQSRMAFYAPQAEHKDTYLLYRTTFELTEPAQSAELEVAADGSFAAFLNGVRLPLYNVFELPNRVTPARMTLPDGRLRRGKNTLVIEVHHIGEDFLPSRKTPPFVYAQGYVNAVPLFSGVETWEYAEHPNYVSGQEVKVDLQLNYTYTFDARPDLTALNWRPVRRQALADDWQFAARRIPDLQELPAPPVKVVQQGYLRRALGDAPKPPTPAESCFSDYLSVRHYFDFFTVADAAERKCWERRCPELVADGGTDRAIRLADGQADLKAADGVYLIVDLGRETLGYLDFALTAPAGTVIDIAYGEHLDDGRVLSAIGGRNFADRYICREGENRFTAPHRRLGCRYLELHFTELGAGSLAIAYVGLIPLEYPTGTPAEFASADRLLSQLNALSARTLKLCMHDHYEDCPWREQGLYAYDSRNQIMYGYYVWGNYQFAASSLDLLGRNFDGRYVEMVSPGNLNLVIPVFSLVWITEIWEHLLYSGDTALAQAFYPQIKTMLERALDCPAAPNAELYFPGEGKRIWNFCEWNGRLSGQKDRLQAPYNIYLCESLRSAAKIGRVLGENAPAERFEQAAERLGQALERTFFSADFGGYLSELSEAGEQHYEHLQIIMLANALVPESRKKTVLQTIYSAQLVPADLSALFYVMRALKDTDPAGRAFLLNYLRRALEPIALSGATSLWETRYGGRDFYAAGSLCHGWSAIMPCFCGQMFLGVTPLAPGFAEFEVKPYAGDLPEASGTVPTPHGDIEIAWRREGDGLHLRVRHPAGTHPCVNSYPECPVVAVELVRK